MKIVKRNLAEMLESDKDDQDEAHEGREQGAT